MRVDRESQVKAESLASKEDASRMEAERRAAVMKAERQGAAVELAFHISDWLHIAF